MNPLTNQAIGQIARELGHTGLALESFGQGTKKGVRWRLECACGWTSLNFVRPEPAVDAGKRHLRASVDRHLADTRRNGGRVLPHVAAG